ncbi:MAG: cation diffusion facilitator family transporter [bacterium]|nr:cation diffusion facilitator family transporter [bacterium]MDD5354430.1 cation diffusion facilitator family transporter [bacterium]MDD5755936.1 cation diffusion facilitator family transporter [bacterium]
MHNHHEERQTNKQGLIIAFIITFVIMIAEIIGGLVSNSLALLSDAGHMFTDAFALGLSLWAIKMAQKPSTHNKTFGYHRLEILAALANGLLLVLISIWIFYEAYQRFFNPPEIKSGLMLIVAFIGLIGNFIGITILQKSSQNNLNVRGALLHMLGDTLSSVGVIIGGVFIAFTGWKMIDPIVSILINGFIIHSAFQLIFESGEVLLEAVPRGLVLQEVVGEVKKVSGVRDMHDLHIWTITSGLHALSGHILIDDQQVSTGAVILQEVKEVLEHKFSITHTTLQLESEACGESLICHQEKTNKKN